MIDLHRLATHGRALTLMGVALAVAVVLVFVVVLADFTGALSREPRLVVQLPVQGAVVADDSPVTYRDVRVGTVVRSVEDGEQRVPEVVVELDRHWLDVLPRDVTATTGPISIFGNQYVQLVPPTGAAGPGLRDGDVIRAADVSTTASLQSTFVSLDEVLDEVSPAKLNAGLSGLASALQGQGVSIGRTLVDLDGYLDRMIPLWPTLVLDLRELAAVSEQLYDDTPAFLRLIENAVVTSRTVVERRADLATLFGRGGRLAETSARLLTDVTASYGDTVAGASSLLRALSQQPRLLTRILVGVDAWARTWAPVLADGHPDVAVERLTIKSPANLTLAMVAGGSPSSLARLLNTAVRPDFANPAPYTSCPSTLCRIRTGGGS